MYPHSTVASYERRTSDTGRVPYLVSGVDIDSSIQEDSDGAGMTPGGSFMQCGLSQLQQGTHRQTGQRDKDRQPVSLHRSIIYTREEHARMYV